MIETQIFHWTGVVIWAAVCGAAVLSVVAAALIAPIYVFHRLRKVWWKWLTMARFANLGWTQAELARIAKLVGVREDAYFEQLRLTIDAVEQVKKERGPDGQPSR